MASIREKRCVRCGVTTSLDDFTVARQNKDGRSSWCRACFSEYNKARYTPRERKRPTPEEIQENARIRGLRWYHRHADELSAQRQQRSDEEKALERERKRRYYDDNKEIWRQSSRRRHARKRSAFIDDVHPLVVLERDDGMCGICGGDVDPADFHVDHIVPVSRGGEHAYYNVQASHPLCNRRKYTRLMEDAA